MKNYKLIIEYDGTAFSGWQTQPGKRTVQETIQQVLQKILGSQCRGGVLPPILVGASRTDAGVHALGQVANVRLSHAITPYKLLGALNGLLPDDISVKSVHIVPESFHSIRSAKKKTYRYLILNSKIRSPFLKNRVWQVREKLDLVSMKEAASFLKGRHDFSAFRGAQSETKTSVREIYGITIRRGGPPWPPFNWGNHGGLPLQIQITANGFLKYMVRNIVGTLVDVGLGRRKPGDVLKILQSKDRKKAGKTAPASGLYLVKVFY